MWGLKAGLYFAAGRTELSIFQLSLHFHYGAMDFPAISLAAACKYGRDCMRPAAKYEPAFKPP